MTVSDSKGLALVVMPKNGKYWRLNYRFEGKQKTLALGTYPTISLAEARIKRDEAKKLLLTNLDPSAQKKIALEQTVVKNNLRFENVAREWWDAQLPRWKDIHAQRVIGSLEKDVFPLLGSQPVTEIKAPDLLNVLRVIEGRGVNETAIKILQRIKSVFNYGFKRGCLNITPHWL